MIEITINGKDGDIGIKEHYYIYNKESIPLIIALLTWLDEYERHD